MGISRARRGVLGVSMLAILAVAGCNEAGEFNLLPPTETANAQSATATAPQGTVIERDVEVPEVFSAVEAGLWDGRPSLGGIWVAHPEVTEPERVMIRNTSNGKFVVGALFRKERDIPGPRLQISSDAATSLGVLAGSPAQLDVVALRREEVPVNLPTEEPAAAPVEPEDKLVAAVATTLDETEAPTPEAPLVADAESAADADGPVDPVVAAPVETADAKRKVNWPPKWFDAFKRKPRVEDAALAETTVASAPPEVTETALDPIAIASAALDEAPDAAADAGIVTRTNPDVITPRSSSLPKPFIQVGIFGVEGNANRTATMMRDAGMVPTILTETIHEKPFYRVIVGPATNSAERGNLLAKIKEVGFTDAYPVTN